MSNIVAKNKGFFHSVNGKVQFFRDGCYGRRKDRRDRQFHRILFGQDPALGRIRYILVESLPRQGDWQEIDGIIYGVVSGKSPRDESESQSRFRKHGGKGIVQEHGVL